MALEVLGCPIRPGELGPAHTTPSLEESKRGASVETGEQHRCRCMAVITTLASSRAFLPPSTSRATVVVVVVTS